MLALPGALRANVPELRRAGVRVAVLDLVDLIDDNDNDNDNDRLRNRGAVLAVATATAPRSAPRDEHRRPSSAARLRLDSSSRSLEDGLPRFGRGSTKEGAHAVD